MAPHEFPIAAMMKLLPFMLSVYRFLKLGYCLHITNVPEQLH